MTTPKQTDPVKVDVGDDKKSIKTRVDRAALVGSMAPTTPTYQNNPTYKAAMDSLVAAGVDLAGAETTSTKADATARAAHGVRDTKQTAYDKAYNFASSNVEESCPTVDEAKECGWDTVTPGARSTLASPTAVVLKDDTAKSLLRIHVQRPPGNKDKCLIQVGQSPTGPFTTLAGNGAKQALSGYAPGTWWVQAALVRASENSAFTGPVSVIIK